MSAAASVIDDYLHRLRNQFYDDVKKFSQQRWILIKGITELADWLEIRGARLPDRRYRQILDEIIVGIQRYGDTGRIQYFCRYFLHVVQKHIAHHGEAYYEEAKSFRNALDQATDTLTGKAAKKVQEAKDDTTDRLAEIHRAIRIKARRPAKKLADQMTFL